MPVRLLLCSQFGMPVECPTELLTRAAGLVLFFAGIIRRSAFLAVAVLLGATAGRAETAALPVTEIASGIFVHNGVHEEASAANEDAIANIGFIIGDEAVAVVDPGGSFAEGSALRAAIRADTDKPIRYVILTHVHPDHILGAAAFRDDHPDFVGHAKLPGALAQRGDYYLRRLHSALGDEANGTEIVPPTVLVSDKLDLDLGHRRLTLQAHGPRPVKFAWSNFVWRSGDDSDLEPNPVVRLRHRLPPRNDIRMAKVAVPAKAVTDRKFEISAWICYEVGKSWAEADGDTAETIDFLEFYAREMLRLAGPKLVS